MFGGGSRRSGVSLFDFADLRFRRAGGCLGWLRHFQMMSAICAQRKLLEMGQSGTDVLAEHNGGLWPEANKAVAYHLAR